MFKVESNAISVGRNLGNLGDRTVRRATVFALNDTAADILKETQENMQRRFDRPTRFTLNAFMVWRANVRDENPYAEVRERPSVGKRHLLKVQERGGRRPQTGLERAISAAMPSNAVTGRQDSSLYTPSQPVDNFASSSSLHTPRFVTSHTDFGKSGRFLVHFQSVT